MDGRPAMLPVSVDVSSIDIQKVRRAESPTEPFVATAERRQEFGDCLLPSQWEDDINLSLILAEFANRPALLSPIDDQYAEGEKLTAKYQPLKVPTDLLVAPAGPVDGVSSTRDITVPAFPPPEGRSVFPIHTWRSPPSAEKSAKFRLQPPETAVLQSGDKGHSLRERANAPDVSLEGPFDIQRVRHHPATPLRSLPEGQGCPFHITSYDLEIGETDSSQEYGVQLHDPRLLEYVGAPESARLLSHEPEYWVEHITWGERRLPLLHYNYSMMRG